MPIVMPEGAPDADFYDRLKNSGAIVISAEDASRQNMYPARIGLLNLMPAPVMKETELRWLRTLSRSVLQIEPVLMKFDDDVRDTAGSSRQQILQRYTPFSEVAEQGLNGLIVTGDNQERRSDGTPQPFNELHYHDDLEKVIDWAESEDNTELKGIIYSCLSSHFALEHRYGLERQIKQEKVFGVYEHEVVGQSPIVEYLNDTIKAPHSRWGDVSPEALDKVGVEVLAANDEVGWLIAEARTAVGGLITYLQGHPEYWGDDLRDEYLRDQKNLPANYFPANDPENKPKLNWATDSRSLLSNWINKIYRDYSL